MIIKGAIDSVHPDKVGGWIYCDIQSVHGAEVLAFLDKLCVGAGRVEVFRQDLADAGLGDGFLGFSFPISLEKPSDCSRVSVRMNGSDVLLLPPQSLIQAPNRFNIYDVSPYNESSIDFVRKRGWLTNSELSFLKFIRELGVFDLSLVRPKAEQQRGLCHQFEPKDFAVEHLSIFSLAEAKVKEIDLDNPSADDILSAAEQLAPKISSLVAILANNPCQLVVIEGSHKDDSRSSSLIGAVHYTLASDRLILLDLLSSFGIEYNDEQTSLKIFVACAD